MKNKYLLLIYITAILFEFTACNRHTDKISENIGYFDSLTVLFSKIDSLKLQFNRVNKKKPIFPDLHISENYKIYASKTPIRYIIKNYNIKLEGNYPIDNSIVYNNKLISLSESGKFQCLSLPDLIRDCNYEKLLNTYFFEYHWLIGNKLISLSKNKYYCLNSNNKWEPYCIFYPLKRQPIIFENSRFIVFNDNFGEWGGSLYWYNKDTKTISFNFANNVGSIIHYDNKYFYNSNSPYKTQINFIDDVTKLKIANKLLINKLFKGEAQGCNDLSNIKKNKYTFNDILIYNIIRNNNEMLYLMDYNGITFLAKIDLKNNIEVVTPIFNRLVERYAESYSSNVDDKYIINLSDFAEGAQNKRMEKKCLIIAKDTILIVNWDCRK